MIVIEERVDLHRDDVADRIGPRRQRLQIAQADEMRDVSERIDDTDAADHTGNDQIDWERRGTPRHPCANRHVTDDHRGDAVGHHAVPLARHQQRAGKGEGDQPCGARWTFAPEPPRGVQHRRDDDDQDDTRRLALVGKPRQHDARGNNQTRKQFESPLAPRTMPKRLRRRRDDGIPVAAKRVECRQRKADDEGFGRRDA